MASHRKTTDRRKKSELFESERRFRLLVDSVVDYAIFMLDPAGTITNWNSGAQRIKGYSANEMLGRNFSAFYTPEDQAAGLPALSLETARREGRFAADGWRVRKDGTRFLASVVIDPIYDDGELIGFAHITRDVTERETASTALLASERQFAMLVESVTDYALYMLDASGHVSSWNAGGQRIKGYASEEIIGQHFSRFYTEADRKAGRPERALRIARETGRFEDEAWRVRKDGSFFWASVVIDPIRDDTGRLIGYAKVTRDITERREAQLAMERMQKRLAESQKMDALGQLTGGVAHDFNNLLMVVMGHIRTLKKAVGEDPKAKRAAESIELATQRGATLTRQLLTFARRQRVQPEVLDLRARIEAFRDVLTSGLGSLVGLLIDIADDTWPTVADASELEMALVNLVINARDAMPDGGIVTIRAENVTVTDDDALPPGDYVAVTVCDTGVGIPPDILPKIFEPFFTTKPVGRGTGLGLSQVYGFAHQAGGTVRVHSELGKGTRITLQLPRGVAQPLAPGVTAAEAKPGHSGRVLLVEDNPDVAAASAGLIEQLGYSVQWVANAEAALDALNGSGIDLVVSDIVMPGKLDGLALARTIRQSHPGLPILLVTGYSEAANSAETAFRILRKPYELHDLSRALTELTTA
jgi:PAS domain S-box-containing protein